MILFGPNINYSFYNFEKFINLLDSILSTNIFKYAKNDKINNMYLKLNAQIKFIDYSNEYYKIINKC